MVSQAKVLLNLLKTSASVNLLENYKIVFIFNYHRIGFTKPDNPFYHVYMVSEPLFKQQIRLLSYLGKFVSLDEIREAENLSALNFAITFDGVSTSVLSVKPFLESRAIPYAICPYTEAVEKELSVPDNERHYLSWDDIKTHFLGSKLVTLVNHSRCHNMVDLSPEEVNSDIRLSVKAYKKHLDFQPVYYAVPFGGVSQDLAMDLTDALHNHNYKGILWGAGGANVIRNPYEVQIIHLSRIHAPGSLYCLLKSLLCGLSKKQSRIIQHIQPVAKRDNFTIISSDRPHRALVFENLAQQGKDHLSDHLFYKYLLHDNPYKHDQPDYYAVESSGRIESILYKFPLNFSLDSTSTKGAYLHNWRKLPVSNDLACGLLLLKLLEKEPVVGGYKPSRFAAKAFKPQRWRKIPVNSYKVRIKKRFNSNKIGYEYKVETYNQYNEAINPLTDMVNDKFPFSIRRSPDFYRWRYDQYPLAKRKYFVLYANHRAIAYFVTLNKGRKLSISDFFCPSVDEFALLFDHIRNYCLSSNIDAVHIETSLQDISDFIENSFGTKPKTFFNYYHFNPKFPQIKSKWKLIENWEHIEFHETQACGEVLLR